MAKNGYFHVKVPKSLSTADIKAIKAELENFLAIEPNELIDAYKLVYSKDGLESRSTKVKLPQKLQTQIAELSTAVGLKPNHVVAGLIVVAARKKGLLGQIKTKLETTNASKTTETIKTDTSTDTIEAYDEPEVESITSDELVENERIEGKRIARNIKQMQQLQNTIYALQAEISKLYQELERRDEEIERLKGKLTDLTVDFEDFKTNILKILNLL